ncbi:HAMP domain-containing protein [Aliishimia ponticola]|uniref:histidine kinase n=1 Tax=Aliishimia ponticola TaxID=2499833 RepID=A0A4S4N8L3_9RHOB|nr:cache domain-containing protein [Aliishimia ponticola]THH34895.1 HAMP domain-containing protein [Aliishimia ponticola]
MTSVRLRLLVLALAPVVVLLPLALLIAITRWSADYDELLISKVESDLRIAEQYLARLMVETSDDLLAVAGSVDFALALTAGNGEGRAFFDAKRDELGLDFLYYLSADDARAAAERWPVIATALTGQSDTQIDVFSAKDLETLSPELAARAKIPLIETQAAVPTGRAVEDRGMVLHATNPVRIAGRTGVLVGGVLLNRNLQFIDTINALVYLNAVTGGELQGTATLFLDDVRVSTNVRLFEEVRALGTRVSAVVRGAVLDDGKTWLNRAFVVNDWYISGYLPLTDSFGKRVGMLYVGFLEAPFAADKQAAIWSVGAALAGVLVLTVPAFLWLARGVFTPLERMTDTMRKVGRGDLSARNGQVARRDEIGQVSSHLDDLLDQVQERDERLRSYAEDLNVLVDQRTAELRTANEKLEETYRQLVMSEKLAAIGEITAGVAHEINNPVAVIQGNMDVVRATLGDDANLVETELTLVDRQIARIQAIVGKLLKFARPGDFAEYTSAVSLAGVVEDCLVLVDHVLSKGHIDVKCTLGDAPFVQADPGELQQVVVNLVMNAAQAMGHDGTLELRLEAQERNGQAGVRLTVADTGPGIPEDKIGSVFDPFFTTKQAEGTGLGLSISQALVQRAGGLITVRNRDEGGAAFDIWLPAADEAEHDSAL